MSTTPALSSTAAAANASRESKGLAFSAFEFPQAQTKWQLHALMYRSGLPEYEFLPFFNRSIRGYDVRLPVLPSFAARKCQFVGQPVCPILISRLNARFLFRDTSQSHVIDLHVGRCG